MIQHVRSLRRPASFRDSRLAGLLGCVGVTMMFGVVASSAAGPALSFAGPKRYSAGVVPISVAIGDLNSDRKPDLATANYGEGTEIQGANSVSVLVNKGGGRFRAGRHYAVGESPGSVAIADLDGDRDPDLAVANEEVNSVSVLLNNGDATFEQ